MCAISKFKSISNLKNPNAFEVGLMKKYRQLLALILVVVDYNDNRRWRLTMTPDTTNADVTLDMLESMHFAAVCNLVMLCMHLWQRPSACVRSFSPGNYV